MEASGPNAQSRNPRCLAPGANLLANGYERAVAVSAIISTGTLDSAHHPYQFVSGHIVRCKFISTQS
jgi:hypothetical protein